MKRIQYKLIKKLDTYKKHEFLQQWYRTQLEKFSFNNKKKSNIIQ